MRFALPILIAVFFLSLAGDGIYGYFAPDDMMNLYGAWTRTPGELLKDNVLFYSNDRPMGSAGYHALFAWFGLNPLPYRVVCFALMLINLALFYLFCRYLSGSREVGVLSCLIGAYHAHLADIYYAPNTLFDLLCFLFYFLAFNYYLRIRREERFPGMLEIAVLSVLYIGALDSKEIAVTLPPLIAVYELLFHPPKLNRRDIGRWITGNARFLWIAVPVTLAYLIGKLQGPDTMTNNPEYLPHVSWQVWVTGWKHYLFDLFYQVRPFTTVGVVTLFTLMLAGAIILRQRVLVFAWFMILIGALPVIFIPPRGLFVLYVSLPGWYLFAGRTLVLARELLSRILKGKVPVKLQQAAVFCAIGIILYPLHLEQKEIARIGVVNQQETMRKFHEQLSKLHPAMPRASKVLFVEDPYVPDDAILITSLRLHYRDLEIQVDRTKVFATYPDRQPSPDYDYRFRLNNRWELTEVTE